MIYDSQAGNQIARLRLYITSIYRRQKRGRWSGIAAAFEACTPVHVRYQIHCQDSRTGHCQDSVSTEYRARKLASRTDLNRTKRSDLVALEAPPCFGAI